MGSIFCFLWKQVIVWDAENGCDRYSVAAVFPSFGLPGVPPQIIRREHEHEKRKIVRAGCWTR